MFEIEEILKQVEDPGLREALLKMLSDDSPKMRTNPASVKQHHDWAGGYHDHVREVMNGAVAVFSALAKFVGEIPGVSQDDVILVSFLHDADKLVRYRPNDGSKHWVKTPFVYEERVLIQESTGWIQRHCAKYGIVLTDPQLHAISCHHGGWSEVLQGPSGASARLHPLAVILHAADLASARIWGVR